MPGGRRRIDRLVNSMRVLLIDPHDTADTGTWTGQRWDRIVDLGMGGKNTYARWTGQFQCPVTTLDSLRTGFNDFRKIRDVLGAGCGRLFDEHGLDWWEIMSILLHGELEALILLQRLVQTIGLGDDVYVSRPGLHASLLACLLLNAKVFPLRRGAQKGGLGHYVRVSNKLSTSQLIDVFWDKYDSGYQFRGRLTRKRPPSTRPVVLLPSAYINVSRTGVAYANTFPDENFLLIATRRSGWLPDLPGNVSAAWLSSYASGRRRKSENVVLGKQFESLLNELKGSIAEFRILDRLGYLDSFPRRFQNALDVRDAWCNVLDAEPARAVLCADDSNPYTRIPLLLARGRGLPNIACHHGALDGRYVFKRTHADVVWAKGKMEQDYLVRQCGVPQEKVEIGAPAMPASWNGTGQSDRQEFRPYVLFISEASDVSGGRPEEFYRDVLPPLADLALASGRELIVKLHPAESQRQRADTVARILSTEQKSVTRIVTGPLTEDLLAKAWFGITVLSTVAIECAIRGIPCFLCKWLEFWPYGYVEQFIRFGAGIGLNDPGEIGKIPDYLEQNPVVADVRENCWQAAAASRLRELLTSPRKECAAKKTVTKECAATQ
jgi:hypothetical protein